MIGLVVDFLTEPGKNLVSFRSQRKTKAMHVWVDVLGPTCPDLCDPLLGTVFIFGRR
jgi:hypothetical protein